MRNQLPIGKSDLRKLRKNHFYHVDKSLFIREILDTPSEVILLPRPRRFGKTLNLSMLRYFFEKNDGGNAGDFAELFDGTAIRNDEVFQRFQGKYPVIYLTFKDVKSRDWPACLRKLKAVVSKEFIRHRYLLDKNILFPEEVSYFQGILNRKADLTDFETAIEYLSEYLGRRYKTDVVILIDEYDAPLQAGYANEYYEDVVDFMRNFLSGGLKDNEHLFKGVLTGVLRVARESIFSGLNNPGVFTLLDEEFNTAFGFTESELKFLLQDNDLSDHYENVSSWYNGYNFGGEVIYNPWSVLSYAASKVKKFKPFWVNTGSMEIIEKLVTRKGKALREELGRLLEGKSIEEPIDDSIVMNDLESRDDLLWTFLLFSGYLKPVERVDDETYTLMIPNREVTKIYRGLIKTWFAKNVASNRLKEMQNALEEGEAALFERHLRTVVKRVMSYHDFSGEPEKVYHALVLGMLVWLSGKYEIKSNRESGYGRYDLALKPIDPGKQGIIMEFRLVEETGEGAPEKTLDEALKQIEARQYETEMIEAGVNDILKLAIAFKGKELWVKEERKGGLDLTPLPLFS